MNKSILTLLNQLKTEWTSLQLNVQANINKVDRIIIELVGDDKISCPSQTNIQQLHDKPERKQRWQTVLEIMKEIDDKIKFYEIIDKFKEKGLFNNINEPKKEELRIRSAIQHLKRKGLIGKTEDGFYFVVKKDMEHQ